MDPKDISITDFRFQLPEASIALYPLAERDASKLLVYRAGAIGQTIYRDIAGELPEGSLLVFNNTRVVEARLVFQKPSGGKVEIFCLEPPPEYGGMAAAMALKGQVRWKCLIGGASKWKPGQVLTKPAGEIVVEARYLEKLEDSFLIELSWRPAELSFSQLLRHAGMTPLPPYIHRLPEGTDKERYQTIYAANEGSVAAPTAGLHFTGAVLGSLKDRGIDRLFVTLHVGAGTFLPVKSPTLGQHVMHTEYIAVSREAIATLYEAMGKGSPVIAVGTTSARTIESLYWLGVKAKAAPGSELATLSVSQWDPYEKTAGIGGMLALAALLDWMDLHGVGELMTTTQLLITPGYTWRLCKGLITNFHQPESTLLLLVASLIGEDWKRVYRYALDNGFRFLSYGDGCLFLP
ncbi:MAG TPA: S-adenosylmethionine:tRNA ribosyltransferase-isomerase [Puia sp.]|nr:S-adenosylmethionine:tRNA ribosyltransferase-isomerase [Puia sp.]